jgi:hypothetical protein
MATPAELTIIVLLAAAGAGLWMVFDRLGQVQRDLEALKRRLEDRAG